MPLKGTMRADGPEALDVASVIASGCGAPALEASRYQRRNKTSGSAGPRGSCSGKLRLRALFRHVLLQLFECRGLQPRDLHLADAPPARDLQLPHLLVKPHSNDRP